MSGATDGNIGQQWMGFRGRLTKTDLQKAGLLHIVPTAGENFKEINKESEKYMLCDSCYHINHACLILSREGKKKECEYYKPMFLENDEEQMCFDFFLGLIRINNEKLSLCTYEPFRKIYELQNKWLNESINNKKLVKKLSDRLQQSPYGDDKIDELEESIENWKLQVERLEKKIEYMEKNKNE